MVDADTLRLFLDVAQSRSISKAAETALMSKAAVKKRLDALEAEVGVELLERSTRGVSLTAAGEVFFQGAKRLLRESSELIEACRSAQRLALGREVRVAHYTDIMFPCIQYCCENYLRSFPNDRCIPVPIKFREVYDAIREGRCDVAFCPRPRPESSAGLASITTFRTPMLALVSSLNPLARKASVTREDLASVRVGIAQPWFAQEEVAAWSKKAFPAFDVVPMPGGIEGMQEVCGEGGVYLFPESDAEVYPSYVNLPLEDPLMMTGSLTYSPAAGEAVLDFVRLTESYMRALTDDRTLVLKVDWSRRPKL